MERADICTVSQLNRYLKGLLDADARLSELLVRGELSNFKTYPSGHHYFTLKDAEGALRCVLFKREAASLRFRPENGMRVVAAGRVTVYPRDGQYQLYCTGLTPEGAGALHLAFEQLKERLREEGLFDPAHKRPLPPYPMRVALITSSAGAAVRDMLRVLRARWPVAKVLLLPVRVQGEEAPPELCGALRYANAHALADLIIIGRGGGSVEDLWAFNDERVARAIFASEIPVISAVGHEPDVTISDFVADLRAATPSNAAELAVPDAAELRRALDELHDRACRGALRRLTRERERLERFSGARVMQNPRNYIDDKRLLLDRQTQRLLRGAEGVFGTARRQHGALAASLDALSPLKVLGRGYSIVYNAGGQTVKDAAGLREGDILRLRMAAGEATAAVRAVFPAGTQEEDRHGGDETEL